MTSAKPTPAYFTRILVRPGLGPEAETSPVSLVSTLPASYTLIVFIVGSFGYNAEGAGSRHLPMLIKGAI